MDKVAAEARQLRDQMAQMRARGEEIPEELHRRRDALESELEFEVSNARQPRGGIPINTDNVQVYPHPEAGQPRPGRPPVPPFQGPERLPSGGLRDVMEALERWRDKTAAWWTRGAVRAEISYKRDAAENWSNQVAN